MGLEAGVLSAIHRMPHSWPEWRVGRRKDIPANPWEGRDAAALPAGEGMGGRKSGNDRTWGGLEARGKGWE